MPADVFYLWNVLPGPREGALEMSHGQLYPGVDVQKALGPLFTVQSQANVCVYNAAFSSVARWHEEIFRSGYVDSKYLDFEST